MRRTGRVRGERAETRTVNRRTRTDDVLGFVAVPVARRTVFVAAERDEVRRTTRREAARPLR